MLFRAPFFKKTLLLKFYFFGLDAFAVLTSSKKFHYKGYNYADNFASQLQRITAKSGHLIPET